MVDRLSPLPFLDDDGGFWGHVCVCFVPLRDAEAKIKLSREIALIARTREIVSIRHRGFEPW